MKLEKPRIDLIYGIDEKSKSLRDTIIYSLQWVMILFYPIVWGYSIVGLGVDFSNSELSNYMVQVIFITGISTLSQVCMGHKLAMISGPNVIPSLAIVAAFSIGGKEYALQSFNAYAISGVIVTLLGMSGVISKIRKYWTPLVSGSMIMMIGISASVTAGGLLASGSNAYSILIGIALALLCGYLSIKGKGIMSSIPVLVTIVLGYIIFILMGDFNWDIVRSMPVITVPKLFPYGLKFPPVDLIVIMVVVNLFSAINLYGNLDGYSSLVGAKLDKHDEKRTFTVFGIVESVIASIFGVPGNVAYGENLGLITLTKVASRFFMIIASIIFIIMSFFGKVGGLMAAMPPVVAGAILLGVASTLIGLGASTWNNLDTFETREIFIVGFSIFLAFALNSLPENFYYTIPRLLGTLLKNPVITVIFLTIFLEQCIFRKENQK